MLKTFQFSLFIFIPFIISCASDDDVSTKESLNIDFAVNARTILNMKDEVVSIFPNPFINKVALSIHSASLSTAIIKISDKKGRFKEMRFTNVERLDLGLDFSKEPEGLYICEVLINNNLYRHNLYRTK